MPTFLRFRAPALFCVHALLALALPSWVQGKEPSNDSLSKLLSVSNVQKTSEQAVDQIDGLLKSMIDESVGAQSFTAEQKIIFEQLLPQFTNQLQRVLTEELSWKKQKDSYLRIYRENFTQEEVDGLIAFYQSPAGKAFLKKMPVVQDASKRVALERVPAITQRLQEISAQLQKKMAAQSKDAPKETSKSKEKAKN